MGEKKERDKVLIDENLLQLAPDTANGGFLLGNKCRSCGESFFPSRYCCRKCTSDDMEEIRLSTKGILHSFTTVRVKLPTARIAPPYMIGIIELPEGERVGSLLADCKIDTVHPGDAMGLKIDTVYIDEEGNEVLGWKFKPIEVS